MKIVYLWAAAVLANGFAGRIVSGGEPSDRALPVGGSGYRTTVGEGDIQIPAIIVRGTPYEMGRHVGRLTRDEIQKFIPTAMARLKPASAFPIRRFRMPGHGQRRTVTTASSRN